MIRIAIYARYSSDLQRDASIEDQVRMAKQHADKMGWKVVDIYTDHAISGASMNRSGLQAMLQDAASGKFHIVLTEGLDRISRDQEHVAGIYKKLTFAGVKIHSLGDGGEINDLHIGLKGTMNALFLKDLAVKTKRGLIGRLQQGKVAGRTSFGYDIVRRFDASGEPVRGERSINQEEALIVRRIFTEFAAGRSGRQIARDLNKDNVPSPKGKGWSDWTINGSQNAGIGIVNNQLYIGKVVWGKNYYVKDPYTGKRVRRAVPEEDWIVGDAPHLRIIEQALWDKAKAQQSARQRGKTLDQKRRPKYLLSYLLKCSECNGGMSIIATKRYGCTNAFSKGLCKNRLTIMQEKLENMVVQGLQSQLLRPKLFEVFCEEYKKHMATLSANKVDTIALAKSKLKKLESEKHNMIEAIKAGMLSEAFKEALEQNAIALEQVKEELKSSAKQPTLLEPDLAVRFHEEIKTLCQNLDSPQNHDNAIHLIRAMIDKVVLTPDWANKKLKASLYGNLAQMLRFASGGDFNGSLLLEPKLFDPSQSEIGSILATAMDLDLES